MPNKVARGADTRPAGACARPGTESTISRRRDAVAPAVVAVVLVAGFAAFSHGLSLTLTFGGGMVLACGAYAITSYRAMPDPSRVLPVYLAALAAQSLHSLRLAEPVRVA